MGIHWLNSIVQPPVSITIRISVQNARHLVYGQLFSRFCHCVQVFFLTLISIRARLYGKALLEESKKGLCLHAVCVVGHQTTFHRPVLLSTVNHHHHSLCVSNLPKNQQNIVKSSQKYQKLGHVSSLVLSLVSF